MNYEQMTLAELQKRQQEIMEEKSKLSDEARQVQAAIDAKQSVAKIYQTLSKMDDNERAALAQVLGVQAIPSAEAFGNIGA